MRYDRHFHADACCPSEAHLQRSFLVTRTCSTTERRAGELGADELIIAPGQPGRAVDKPGAQSVADAAAHRSEHLHRVGKAGIADSGGRNQTVASNPIRKGYVGLGAEHEARRKRAVVTGLQTAEVTSRPLESVESIEKIDRTAQRWCGDGRRVGGPIGMPAGI